MDQMSKKIDRRIVKTKKAIRNAFLELLAQKDINEITIKDIADTADINRKTFYNYYSGVHQVVDEIENEMVIMLNKVMGEIDLKRDLIDPYQIFIKLAAAINDDLDFFRHLMQIDNNSNLIVKTTAALKEKAHASLLSQTTFDIETLDIIMEYTFSGMLAVYRSWVHSDQKNSIEELAKLVSRLAASGLNGVLEGDKMI